MLWWREKTKHSLPRRRCIDIWATLHNPSISHLSSHNTARTFCGAEAAHKLQIRDPHVRARELSSNSSSWNVRCTQSENCRVLRSFKPRWETMEHLIVVVFLWKAKRLGKRILLCDFAVIQLRNERASNIWRGRGANKYPSWKPSDSSFLPKGPKISLRNKAMDSFSQELPTCEIQAQVELWSFFFIQCRVSIPEFEWWGLQSLEKSLNKLSFKK